MSWYTFVRPSPTRRAASATLIKRAGLSYAYVVMVRSLRYRGKRCGHALGKLIETCGAPAAPVGLEAIHPAAQPGLKYWPTSWMRAASTRGSMAESRSPRNHSGRGGGVASRRSKRVGCVVVRVLALC